jgi:hypothetical protein
MLIERPPIDHSPRRTGRGLGEGPVQKKNIMNSNMTTKHQINRRNLANVAASASGVFTSPHRCQRLAIVAVFPSPHPMGRGIEGEGRFTFTCLRFTGSTSPVLSRLSLVYRWRIAFPKAPITCKSPVVTPPISTQLMPSPV